MSLTLVDASYRTDVVYATCKELAPIVKPAMGIGQSAGCVQARWEGVTKRSDVPTGIGHESVVDYTEGKDVE